MYLGNHPSFHMLIIKTRVQFLSFKMFSAWKHFRFAKRKVRLPNGRYSTALKLMKHLPSLYKIDSNKVYIHSRLLWIELRFNSFILIKLLEKIIIWKIFISSKCKRSSLFDRTSWWKGLRSRWENIQNWKCCFENKSNTKCFNATFSCYIFYQI